MNYSNISSISGTSCGKWRVDTSYTGDHVVTTSTNPYLMTDYYWKINNKSVEAEKELADRLMNQLNKSDKKENKKDMKKETKTKVMPYDIVDYKIIDNTVVIFTFGDGTTEKTVCDHEFDEFELKRAIELAICKKKFGGTKAYNNAVRKAIKQIKNIDARKKAESEEQERIAHRKAKYAERQAKRKAKRRQEQIDIQTEAFYKAMMKYDDFVAAASCVPDKNVKNTEDSYIESTETE